jgi:hypothetical protein
VIVVKSFGAAFAGLENKSDDATTDIRVITRKVFFIFYPIPALYLMEAQRSAGHW